LIYIFILTANPAIRIFFYEDLPGLAGFAVDFQQLSGQGFPQANNEFQNFHNLEGRNHSDKGADGGNGRIGALLF
jgi:hypothetical protein